MSHLVKLMIASVAIYLSIVALVLNILSQNLDLSVNQILSHSFTQKGHKMKNTSNFITRSSHSLSSLDQDSHLYSKSAQLPSLSTFSHGTDFMEKGAHTSSNFSAYQTLELNMYFKK